MNAGKLKTILLVEDDALTAMMERKQLEREGYAIVQAFTGEKAVELVLGGQERVDLILMDIDLGRGIDGTVAAQRILAQAEIPILFLSSHTEQEIVEKTERISSYGYVVKSSSFTVLDASIKMAFKLFESRRLYQRTFDHNISGLCIHRVIRDADGSPSDCEYVKVNAAFERQTGLSAESLAGRTIRDVFPEGPADEIIALYFEAFTSGEAMQREVYFEPLENWFQLTVFPISDEEFTVSVQNITEHKKAIAELQESEIRFKALHNASFGGIAIHEKGVILECNLGLSEMTGYRTDELIGMDGLRLIAESSRPAVRANIASGYEKSYEAFGLRKNGETYPMRLEARNIPYKGRNVRVVEFRDISELKQSRLELERNHEYLHSILETMHDGFWAVDGRLRFTDVNAAYCAMSGYTKDEFLRLGIQDIDADERPEETDAHRRRILEAGHDIFQTRHRRKDGSVFHVEVSVMHLTIPENRFICFSRDITERRQVEARVRSLLDDKELLLRETHHRVKNDMSMIYSLLCLQADDQGNPEARPVLLDAASRIQGMLMLYGKLYCASGDDSLGARDFLPPLVNEILGILPSTAAIRAEVAVDDVILSARTLSRLGIIVNELLTNSVKYAFPSRSEGLVRLTLSHEGSGVRLEYSDDGVGLPSEVRSGSSSGFGMQLIGMMVQELGGTLEVQQGSGAHFSISCTL